MKTKTIFALLPIVFAFTMPGDKETFTLNTANRDKVKTIALASVYGENMGGIYNIQKGKIEAYYFNVFEQQKCYDYLEKALVGKFNGINMSVVPLDKTKPLFSDTMANIQIMREVMGKPMTEKEVKGMKANMDFMAKISAGTKNQPVTFTEKYGMNLRGILGTHEISSANTAGATMIENGGNPGPPSGMNSNVYSGRAGAPNSNDNFAKTFGRVAKKANADGFALVKMESFFGADSTDTGKDSFFGDLKRKNNIAHVILYVYVYTSEGELVFHDEVIGFSKEGLKFETGGGHTIYDSNVYAVLNDATDDAVRIAFSHLK